MIHRSLTVPLWHIIIIIQVIYISRCQHASITYRAFTAHIIILFTLSITSYTCNTSNTWMGYTYIYTYITRTHHSHSPSFDEWVPNKHTYLICIPLPFALSFFWQMDTKYKHTFLIRTPFPLTNGHDNIHMYTIRTPLPPWMDTTHKPLPIHHQYTHIQFTFTYTFSFIESCKNYNICLSWVYSIIR